MKAPRFTPGPWSVVPYGDHRNTSLVIHYSPQNRVCFMATAGQRGSSYVEIEANAHLIAASPLLYWAGVKALRIMEERLSGNDQESERTQIDDLRSALALARGEQ